MKLKFDFNNLFEEALGEKRGLTQTEISKTKTQIEKAAQKIKEYRTNRNLRIKTNTEWLKLPYQDSKLINRIIKIGNYISKNYKDVISLGIGGSFLGNKMLQEALGKNKAIHFEGNNVDPESLSAILAKVSLAKTAIIVISKSGETTETKAAFEVIKQKLGPKYHKNIFAITAENKGMLRKWADEAGAETFPVPAGVGGRFSVLSPAGLLTAVINGINIKKLLAGAAQMDKITQNGNIYKNPAYLYASLHYLAYKEKGLNIAILMPFANCLKTLAQWYIQLLAESLGKKFSLAGKMVNVGRTPIAALGTQDLHSIQQNNVEGEYNKTVTFLKVEKFRKDLTVPKSSGDFLAGRKFSELMNTALAGTEWALRMEGRPSCTITLPEINENTLGQLIFFFEVATAFEGELLGVNAYDQPGVQSYKDYLFAKLGKPGTKSIKASVKKNSRWIL